MDSIKADLILRNADVITLDRRCPHARTIYIHKDRILKVSSADIERNLAGAHTRVIDCRGKTVMPAFHDAHCHIAAYAESLINIDISPASVRSIGQIITKIKEAAAGLSAGQWIRCTGYNEFYLKERRHPDRHDLDSATTSHPVKITHRSGHAHVLNTPALKLAGISNESEEPDGGMIERDLESGEPNGILYGMGAFLAERLPRVSGQELDAAIKNTGNILLSLGITSVQDASPGNDFHRWQQFLEWKRKGLFVPRSILMFNPLEMINLPWVSRYGTLSSGAVKLVLDEVRGQLNPAQAEINRTVLEIHRRELQVAIHSVEENTVRAAIEALEQAVHGKGRHRMEHCSICTPEDARRLASLGATVVTNPAFIYYSGERYLSDVPEHQLKHLYAINTMLRAGLVVAAGSDSPVAAPDPVKGIYAAVTRRAQSGHVVLEQEAITVMDALRLYTSGAAYSCCREKELGTVSKGKYADLVILNANPLQVDPEQLLDIRVEMTLLNGETVYTA